MGRRSVARVRFATLSCSSDDAGQFNVGRHALCWVHAERLVHKLNTFTGSAPCRATAWVRGLIWDFYA